jgi:hypothetical protein
MVDTTPLQKIVAKQVDDDILAAVAQAHKQGRRLFISTATMEAGGFVIWDMGAIAASGKPGALEFLRKVMLASASIHGAFPPMHIPMEAGGQRYEEMRVEGGRPLRSFSLALPWIWMPPNGNWGSRTGASSVHSSSPTASSPFPGSS